MTPWEHLNRAISAHEAAKARILVAEQFAHLSPEKAQALEDARREERRSAEFRADAQAEVDRLAREEAERRRIVPPDRWDLDVLKVLDRLERWTPAADWETSVRGGTEVERRALRHLAWLRELRRRGGTVAEWMVGRCT